MTQPSPPRAYGGGGDFDRVLRRDAVVHGRALARDRSARGVAWNRGVSPTAGPVIAGPEGWPSGRRRRDPADRGGDHLGGGLRDAREDVAHEVE
jgi:hypothetical protein